MMLAIFVGSLGTCSAMHGVTMPNASAATRQVPQRSSGVSNGGYIPGVTGGVHGQDRTATAPDGRDPNPGSSLQWEMGNKKGNIDEHYTFPIPEGCLLKMGDKIKHPGNGNTFVVQGYFYGKDAVGAMVFKYCLHTLITGKYGFYATARSPVDLEIMQKKTKGNPQSSGVANFPVGSYRLGGNNADEPSPDRFNHNLQPNWEKTAQQQHEDFINKHNRVHPELGGDARVLRFGGAPAPNSPQNVFDQKPSTFNFSAAFRQSTDDKNSMKAIQDQMYEMQARRIQEEEDFASAQELSNPKKRPAEDSYENAKYQDLGRRRRLTEGELEAERLRKKRRLVELHA